MTMSEEQWQKGLETVDEVYGPGFHKMMEPLKDVRFNQEIVANQFGNLWSDPAMSIRDKRLMVLGATTMLGRADLIEIRPMLRGQGNADAGVGSDLVTEALVRCADCIENARNEVGDVVLGLDRGLNDGEFVASQSGDEVVAADATAKAQGYGFQQFIADHVSERIVDALEFVDVDVQHCQLLTGSDVSQFLLQALAKQGAVRQVGQRVIMCEMCDPFLGVPAFRDVLVGRYPSAIG